MKTVQLDSVSYPSLRWRFVHESIAEKLAKFKKRWKEETLVNSDFSEVISNEWFLKIIGLGPDVLPYLYPLIEAEGGLWCIAVEAITDVTPDVVDGTDFRELSTFWLNWLRDNGYATSTPSELGLRVVAAS